MAVLVISGSVETHGRLRFALDELRLPYAVTCNLQQASRLLASGHWSVVVTEAGLPDGNWRDVLDCLPVDPLPAVVVTDRLADEHLWSEVLHRGGYDVLAQPFDDGEILRVLTLAYERLPAFPESSRSSHDPLTLVADNLPYDPAA